MSVSTDATTPVRPETLRDLSDRPRVLLKDVLELRRAHARGDFLQTDEPESLDDCLVLPADAIGQYHLKAIGPWANYEEIRRSFDPDPNRRDHRTPYPREMVFAPVKVVLSEQDDPLRAAVTFEPVYPRRGNIGILRRSQPLALAYCVVAILNSALGTAYYHRLHQELRGTKPTRFGLLKAAIDQIPIRHVEAPPEQTIKVAALAYQISALSEAERECNTFYWREKEALQLRLLCEIERLLMLPREESVALIDTVQELDLADARQRHLFEGDLPPLPPLQLLTTEQLRRYEQLARAEEQGPLAGEEVAEKKALNRFRFWEEAVRATPEFVLEPESQYQYPVGA